MSIQENSSLNLTPVHRFFDYKKALEFLKEHPITVGGAANFMYAHDLEIYPVVAASPEDAALVNTKKEGSKSYAVGTRAQFCHAIMTGREIRRCYYEYWMDHPVCLVLDFDLWLTGPKADTSRSPEKLEELCRVEGGVHAVVWKLVDKIRDVVRKTFQYPLDRSAFLIQTGCRSEKISYHIKCKRIKFRDIDDQRFFWQAHCAEFMDAGVDFDMSIYYRMKPLRTVFSHKWRLDGVRIPTLPIIDGITCSEISQELLVKYSMTDFSGIGVDEIFLVPKQEVPNNFKKGNRKIIRNNQRTFLKNNGHMLSGYVPDYPDSSVKEYMKYLSPARAVSYSDWLGVGMVLKAVSKDETRACLFHTWVEFSKQYKGYDDFEVQERWGKFLVSSETDRLLYSDKRLISWAQIDSPDFHYQPELRDLFQECKENNWWGAKVETISERFLPDLSFDESTDTVTSGEAPGEAPGKVPNKGISGDHRKTLMIISGQGSDKTGKGVKLISHLEAAGKLPHGSLVCISRQNLSTTIASKSRHGYYGYKADSGMPLVELTDYRKHKTRELHEQRNLICTPNALIHLVSGNQIAPRSLLWIDEATPFLSYLIGDTLVDRRTQVLTILAWLIRSVDYLLVTDADLNDDGIYFIRKLRSGYCKIILNVFKTDCNKYHYTSDYSEWLMWIDGLLKAGEHVYIATDTKKSTLLLAEIFKKYNPLVYNADTNSEDRKLLENIDTEWIKYQLIITNSVNEYGVSFDDRQLNIGSDGVYKPHFHTVFAFFNGHTITAQGANQLAHRVRKTETDDIYIYLARVAPIPMSTDLASMEMLITSGESNVQQVLDQLVAKERHTISNMLRTRAFDIDESGKIVQTRTPILDEIMPRVLRNRLESISNFYGWLRFYNTRDGGTIVVDDVHLENESEEARAEKKLWQGVVKEKTQESLETVVNNYKKAPDYSEDEALFVQYQDHMEYNNDQIWGLRKFYLKRKLGLNVLSDGVLMTVAEDPLLLQKIGDFRMFCMGEDGWKTSVLYHDKDALLTMGLNTCISRLVLIDKYMKLLGWKGGFDLNETIRYWTKEPALNIWNDDLAIFFNSTLDQLRQEFGYNACRTRGNIAFKDFNRYEYMIILRRIINHTFGPVMNVSGPIKVTELNNEGDIEKKTRQSYYEFSWNIGKMSHIKWENRRATFDLNIYNHVDLWIRHVVLHKNGRVPRCLHNILENTALMSLKKVTAIDDCLLG